MHIIRQLIKLSLFFFKWYDYFMIAAIALLIATLIPLLFLYNVHKLDLYKTGAFRDIAASFIWGLIAYIIVVQINPTMVEMGIISHDNMVRFSAPIIEEILKGIILVYLIRQASFTYFVDGAIYGFAAGIGFAIIENFEYVLGSPETALIQAIGRVLSTNLMHATGSGLIGIALGIARFDRSTRRTLVFLSGLALAMIQHIAFNNLVTRVNSGLLLLYAAIAGFTGAGFIAYMIRRGLNEEKRWIEENLGHEDGVTVQEASAVQQLSSMETFLAPVAEKFGLEKASQIEKFLLIQARLGILRKTLGKFAESGEENLRQATENQINSLRDKMDESRRQVGTYCMLYLRGTFLQESSPLWGRLQQLIQERSQSNRKSNAPSLWGTLNTKLTEPARSTSEK